MRSIRLQSFYLLEAEIPLKFKESGMAVLFALGLGSIREVRGRRLVRLSVEIPPRRRRKNLIPALRSLEQRLFGTRLLKRLRVIKLGRGSWIRAQHRALKPFEFLPGLWIDPSDKTPLPSRTSTLYIPASLAFGTGTHPSTQLAALYIKDSLKDEKKSVLDVGCGTGILAMASVRLGAAPIAAVDNDPEALTMARRNFQRNAIKNILLTKNLNAVRKKFDIVVANITFQTILQLKKPLLGRLKPRALLILSGLLYRDCEAVLSAYRDLRLVERRNRRGWAALLLQKKFNKSGKKGYKFK